MGAMGLCDSSPSDDNMASATHNASLPVACLSRKHVNIFVCLSFIVYNGIERTFAEPLLRESPRDDLS